MWHTAFARFLCRERFDLVVPCDDPTTLPLQQHRDELLASHCIYLLGSEAFAVTTSKLKTTHLARSCGIPVPRGFTVHSESDLSGALERLALPIVVKPNTSYRPDALRAKQLVRTSRTIEDARKVAARMLHSGPVQLQEHLRGIGVGVELLAYEGQTLFAFQHERVHEPLAGGGSSYRMSTVLDPELLHAAQTLLEALRYTGVAMVEFKVDRDTGKWAVLEVNGRFWGSLPLAVAAGADFPFYLYQMLVEGRRSFSPSYRVGLYCRNWMKDAAWLWHNITADHTDPLLMTVPLTSVVRELGNVLTLRERSDTFVFDDPMPALAEVGHLARAAVGAVSARLGRGPGRKPSSPSGHRVRQNHRRHAGPH